jgi:hypothetical protein
MIFPLWCLGFGDWGEILPLSQPQRDQNGLVLPHNHPELQPAHRVIRRISLQMVVPGRSGGLRLSTAVFEPSSLDVDPYRGVSVDLESLIIDDGVDPSAYLVRSFVGAIVVPVSSLRALNLLVGYDPRPDNIYHGAVWEDGNLGRLTRRTKRDLLKASEWLIQIGGVALTE